MRAGLEDIERTGNFGEELSNRPEPDNFERVVFIDSAGDTSVGIQPQRYEVKGLIIDEGAVENDRESTRELLNTCFSEISGEPVTVIFDDEPDPGDQGDRRSSTDRRVDPDNVGGKVFQVDQRWGNNYRERRKEIKDGIDDVITRAGSHE